MKIIKRYNVLIFPADSEIGIEIYDSLKYNLHFKLFGASIKPNHAKHMYPADRYIDGEFLNINKKDFIKDINNVIDCFGIDFIFPTHDSVALHLSEYVELLGAELACSDKRTTKISRNKKEIYNELKDYAFIPKVYNDINNISDYPVFLKPFIGEGGKGTKVAYCKRDIEETLVKDSNYVICEYLTGEEYTVDCFSNREGKLLFVGPRTRERITNGISYRSNRVQLNDEFLSIANKLNRKFMFRGGWFFQVKLARDGRLKLLEFSVRQSTTMGLYRQLGINFALLTLFDLIGYDLQICFNDLNIELDRRLLSSYKLDFDYETLYIDFDDTLVVNNEVNTTLMKLIYQSINNNKRIILLTKHERDINITLDTYCISNKLFNKIYKLDNDESKADYIEINSKSIFIDNHFPERIVVKKKCGIPVFDVDAIESLIDHRKL